MNTESLIQNAHLFLGLSRNEFSRRLENGQIDLQLLRGQIEQFSREIKQEALCEKWIDLQSLEQIDKYTTEEISDSE